MKRSDAVKLIALIQGAFSPTQAFPESTVEAYTLGLIDLDYGRANAAVVELVRTSRFLPKVAEIREAIVEAELELPAPELAWEEVLEAIRRVGPYRTPTWSSPEVAAAVRAVGWRTMLDSTNIQSERRCFIDAYRAARAKAVRGEQSRTHEHVPEGRRLQAPMSLKELLAAGTKEGGGGE